MTILQAKLIANEIADERLFIAKIHGCDVEDKSVKEATEEDLNMLLGMFG